MLDALVFWIVATAFAGGFMLSIQAAAEAGRRRDRAMRLMFYGMSALIALLGVAVAGS